MSYWTCGTGSGGGGGVEMFYKLIDVWFLHAY